MPSILLSLRNARLQVIADALDAGAAGGKLKFYTGTSPGIANAATGTALGTCTFSTTCGTVSAAVLTFSTVTDGTGLADGTAGYARGTDSDDNSVIDFTVGASGSGKEIILTNVNVVTGGTISVDTSGGVSKITEGNA